jgi:hypothetical protein
MIELVRNAALVGGSPARQGDAGLTSAKQMAERVAMCEECEHRVERERQAVVGCEQIRNENDQWCPVRYVAALHSRRPHPHKRCPWNGSTAGVETSGSEGVR